MENKIDGFYPPLKVSIFKVMMVFWHSDAHFFCNIAISFKSVTQTISIGNTI